MTRRNMERTMNEKLHPAGAEHLLEENEKLRGLLREISDEMLLDNDMAARIEDALSQQAEPASVEVPVVKPRLGKFTTSEGGRAYVADFFKGTLKRHDFTRYINERLAADFACALADGMCQLLATQRPVEPAPAQDEREDWSCALLQIAVVLEALLSNDREARLKSMNAGKVLAEAYANLKGIRAARPAQTEQQPVRLPARKEGNATMPALHEQRGWNSALDEVVRLNAAPVAQTELVEALDPYAVAEQVRKALDRNACPNVFLVIAYEEVIAALAEPAKPTTCKCDGHGYREESGNE